MKKLKGNHKVIVTSVFRQNMLIFLTSLLVAIDLLFLADNLFVKISDKLFLFGYAVLLLLVNAAKERWNNEFFRNTDYFLRASMLGVAIVRMTKMDMIWALAANCIIMAGVLIVTMFGKSEKNKASEKYLVNTKFE